MSSYATPADLSALALPTGALPAYLTTSVQQQHLDAASDLVDSFIANWCTLPLLQTPNSIKMKVCQIAAFTLLSARGYNPDNGQDELMKSQHDMAMEWLGLVSEGRVRPPIVDSAPGGFVGGPNALQAATQSTSQTSVGGMGSVSSNGTVVIGPPALRGWK